ncbi:universal stress protein [Arthrobacter sp. TMN-37]
MDDPAPAGMALPIVVGFDGSPAGRAAVEWAARRAGAQGHPVTLVHAVHEYWLTPKSESYGAAIAAARDLLEAGAHLITAVAPEVHVRTHTHRGDVVRALSDLSEAAEMVVLGSDKNDPASGQLIGAVSQQVAVMSLSPVAVIPVPDDAARAGVVVGTDGSPEAVQAVDWAAAEAERTGEDLLILTSCAVPSSETWVERPRGDAFQAIVEDHQRLLDRAAAMVGADHPGVRVRVRLETVEPAAEALLREASSAGLLVVGSLGRGGLRRMLLGSVSHRILLNLTSPTLVTRPRPAGRP